MGWGSRTSAGDRRSGAEQTAVAMRECFNRRQSRFDGYACCCSVSFVWVLVGMLRWHACMSRELLGRDSLYRCSRLKKIKIKKQKGNTDL